MLLSSENTVILGENVESNSNVKNLKKILFFW